MQSSAMEDAKPVARFYRPELDVLRLLAFLLVFLRHCITPHTPLQRIIVLAGQNGVCLFFLLSSYLITELLDRELSRTHRISLSHFYLRRILRIWPLYFAALFLAWLIDLHSATPQFSGHRMAAYLLLAGNFYTAHYGMPASFVGVLWSVSVEEQFYLVWPSLRKLLSRRALMGAAYATLPVSYATIFWIYKHDPDPGGQIWFNTLVEAQFFALGGLLALTLHGRAPRWPAPARLLLLLCGLLAFFASQYVQTTGNHLASPWYASLQYLLLATGTVLLFLAALGFSSFGRLRPLVELGKISYGLYVFHILAFRLTERPIDWLQSHRATPLWFLEPTQVLGSFALTVLMAAISYRYFETPFLRLKDRFAAVHSRPV